jgi:6,7-dimethyl-8-ribityllumazine synthase
MPRVIEGSLDAKGLKFALVVSRFNSLVTEELLKGALDTLTRHGANPEQQTIVRVPGGWELPVVVKAVLDKGGVDGVIALGCVMKGQTTHNDTIIAEASKGLGQLAMATGIPVTFGVLTPNSLEQALERAGLKMGNKGSEAAEAAIETANLLRKLAK